MQFIRHTVCKHWQEDKVLIKILLYKPTVSEQRLDEEHWQQAAETEEMW